MILCQDAIGRNRIKPKVCETPIRSGIVAGSQVNYDKLYCDNGAEFRKAQRMERKSNVHPKDRSDIVFVKTAEVCQRGVYEAIEKK